MADPKKVLDSIESLSKYVAHNQLAAKVELVLGKWETVLKFDAGPENLESFFEEVRGVLDEGEGLYLEQPA